MNEVVSRLHRTETVESVINEFELTLSRLSYSFLRWQEDCELATNNTDLTSLDVSILHVIKMQDRPKGITDIARIMSRGDIYNLTYCVKKLLRMGLIEKPKGTTKKGATYQITAAGLDNINTYLKARKQLLITLFEKEPGLNLHEIINGLTRIKAIYDEGSKLTASYKEQP